MPKNTLLDLRNHLFATLEALQDKEKPLEVDRARAIVSVAKTVIDSAKVEVSYLEVTGQLPSQEFFGKALPAHPQKPNGKLLRAS